MAERVAGTNSNEFSASTIDRGCSALPARGASAPGSVQHGERELVADYTTIGPEGDQGPDLPLIVWWDDLAQRYELRALAEDKPPASADRQWAGSWPAPYVLRDTGNGTELRGYPVDGYLVIPEAGPYPPTLVVGDDTYAATQFGVAVSQYSMFWTAGRIHLINPNRGCDTTVVVNPNLSLDHILRAAIGLTPQRLSTVHVSCVQVVNPPDGSG
jgi:hypothetical protein